MFKYVFKTITIFKTKSDSDLQDNKLILEVQVVIQDDFHLI